jgi:hypothetical protein
MDLLLIPRFASGVSGSDRGIRHNHYFVFWLLKDLVIQDPKVNRLEDSLLLWKAVASNKLLANVNIVLFLNKCDLLQV